MNVHKFEKEFYNSKTTNFSAKFAAFRKFLR